MIHKEHLQPIVLKPNEGRTYDCGKMQATFKADEEETNYNYSVSEWWMDANSKGPGIHLHKENDEIFYILDGTASIFIDDDWINAEKGTFIRVPSNTLHDFENRTSKRMGLLNFFLPGGFEGRMPSIVKWFKENPHSK